MPNLDWRDFDLSNLIPSSWTWPVFIENDVRMGTYGEWKQGAAKGSKHVFGVFCGTGVGGGLILNGQLYNGFNGHAGEIGHIVLHYRRGVTLGGIAGRALIMNSIKALLDDSPKRVRNSGRGVDLAAVKSSQLAEFYQKDDPIAVQLIDEAARALGAAIGSVINLLSPEVVVIGGGVAGRSAKASASASGRSHSVSFCRAAENVGASRGAGTFGHLRQRRLCP